MKAGFTARQGASAALLLSAGVGLMLMLYRPSPNEEIPKLPANQNSAETANEESPSDAGLRRLAEDSRPEVRQFAQFAAVANLYNFNPAIVGWIARTNRNGAVTVVFDTPTHTVSVIGGRMDLVRSGMDSSVAHMDTNNTAAARLYECAGTWSDEAALEETLSILERIGDRKKLEIIRGGKHEVRAERLVVRDPQGNPVEVTPFYTVHLRDSAGNDTVRAQYRMGSNGPAGLVDWWNWP